MTFIEDRKTISTKLNISENERITICTRRTETRDQLIDAYLTAFGKSWQIDLDTTPRSWMAQEFNYWDGLESYDAMCWICESQRLSELPYEVVAELALDYYEWSLEETDFGPIWVIE